MEEIKSYRDLLVWQKGITLVKLVYKITNQFPPKEIYSLASQMQRAAVSVPANIAEGMGRNTTKELLSFTFNARGSVSEMIYHLILSKDLGYLDWSTFDSLYKRYNGLAMGINAFIAKLKSR